MVFFLSRFILVYFGLFRFILVYLGFHGKYISITSPLKNTPSYGELPIYLAMIDLELSTYDGHDVTVYYTRAIHIRPIKLLDHHQCSTII